MLARCTACDARILAGGETYLDRRFCGEPCVTQFRMALVDQFVPREVVDRHVRQVFEGPCPLCGTPAFNDVHAATRVSAFLVFFNIQTEQQICCPSCARRNRLKAALHCLVAGWWGPRAAICNLFILPTNLVRAVLVQSPSEPSPALITRVKSSMAESLVPGLLAAEHDAPDDLDEDPPVGHRPS